MRALALALLVVALGAAAAGAEGQAGKGGGRMQCLKKARQGFGECQRRVREQCRVDFDAALQGCFGAGDPCLERCQTEQRTCVAEPEANLAGCRAACAADLKVANRNCPTTGDGATGCVGKAREQALKCRQRCLSTLGPAKERCNDTYKDCLTGCAQGG